VRKQILAVTAVIGVISVLIFIQFSSSDAGVLYDANIPYVPPYPGSTELERSADPGVPFGEVASRLVVSLPENTEGVALSIDNDTFQEYNTLLEQHGWQGLRHGASCNYMKYIHEDTVQGPGWTLSLHEEHGKDGTYLIEALVTRGNKTGPQSCGDL
jgi:hypothetical protein